MGWNSFAGRTPFSHLTKPTDIDVSYRSRFFRVAATLPHQRTPGTRGGHAAGADLVDPSAWCTFWLIVRGFGPVR